MIVGLHHVKITVPTGTEAQARAFYCGVLGLPEIPKPPELQRRGGFWVQVGRVALYVALQDGVDRSSKAHIGYAVSDVSEWRERLAGAGIQVSESLPVASHERFECHDPFGNLIEIQRV